MLKAGKTTAKRKPQVTMGLPLIQALIYSLNKSINSHNYDLGKIGLIKNGINTLKEDGKKEPAIRALVETILLLKDNKYPEGLNLASIISSIICDFLTSATDLGRLSRKQLLDTKNPKIIAALEGLIPPENSSDLLGDDNTIANSENLKTEILKLSNYTKGDLGIEEQIRRISDEFDNILDIEDSIAPGLIKLFLSKTLPLGIYSENKSKDEDEDKCSAEDIIYNILIYTKKALTILSKEDIGLFWKTKNSGIARSIIRN